MVELLSLSGVGFLLGLRHAFEPDHLAAVSTLATRERGLAQAARLGTAWGLGHTLSVGLAVVVVMVLDLALPAALQTGAELLVAVLLVGLGATSLVREARARRQRDRAERQGAEEAAVVGRGARQSFGFGLVHGLAGSGSIVVLLAATAVTTREQLASFLPFGLGTIAGMLLVSLLVSTAAGAAKGRWPVVLRAAMAAASVGVGLWWGWGVLAELAARG